MMAEHNVTYAIDSTTDGVAQVTFTCGTTDITHARGVNVHDCVDADAVAVRMGEVAMGVAHKIKVGAITAPEESEDAGIPE
jgi:hypothetical protein